MVNKKGTKRKTRWRTLSIGDVGAAVAGGSTSATSDMSSSNRHHIIDPSCTSNNCYTPTDKTIHSSNDTGTYSPETGTAEYTKSMYLHIYIFTSLYTIFAQQ